MSKFALLLTVLATTITVASTDPSRAQGTGAKRSCDDICTARWGQGGRSYAGCLSSCEAKRGGRTR